MHAAAEQQAGSDLAAKAVADWAVRVFQSLGQILQVTPEVGAQHHLELDSAVGRYRDPFSGTTCTQRRAVEVTMIRQAAHWQPEVIGVVNAKAKQEALLQQPGLEYLDLYQANLRILKVAADPAGASCQGCMQTDDKRQADVVRPCKHCVTPVDAASVSTGWRVATCCSWKKTAPYWWPD